MTDVDDVPDLLPTDAYILADRLPGEPLFDTARLPKCPSCGRWYVPLDDGDGGMTTSHGLVNGTPVCTGEPLPAPKPVPRRVTRAAREMRARTRTEQIESAAQLIFAAAQANRVNFTAALWRIPMDKAGVSMEIRRHAVVHAVRAGWIEAMNLVAEFDPGGDLALEQYDRRDTRWRSLVYVPLRRNRRRPTTNGPS